MRTSDVLNNYANSMFRYEFLHETWLKNCEQYLNYVFDADAIAGKVVVDYAFGRGNWSIAFARSGAKKVIAIDASEDNCNKLRQYCQANKIDNVEVIWGNLDEKDIEFCCDILWFYGILPMLKTPKDFLSKILPKVNAEGVVLAYTYNADSLRQWLVTTAREGIIFSNESEFRSQSLWFTPSARLRARDDLVAPHINWDSATSFVQQFVSFGWKPVSQLMDFAPWIHNRYSGEFNPYVVKFSRLGPVISIDSQEDSSVDIKILKAYSQLIIQKLPQEMRTSFAVGLFNTHFHNLHDDTHVNQSYKTNDRVVWEDFKYLVYTAAMLSIEAQDFSKDIAEVWNASMRSLRGESCVVGCSSLVNSLICEKLATTTMRI